MAYTVPVGISNKHIHLSQKDLEVLFGEGAQLTFKKDLKQPNQFAAEEQVTIVGPKGQATVRVLGPVRKETQVELSATDARTLGLKGVPMRQSGKLEGTPGMKVIGPKGEVELDHGVIIAQRHIHLNDAQAKEAGVVDQQVVSVKVVGKRIEALHIHDNNKHNDSHEMPFTMNINFAPIGKALKNIGYSGDLTLEADAYLRKHSADDIEGGLKKLAESARKFEKLVI